MLNKLKYLLRVKYLYSYYMVIKGLFRLPLHTLHVRGQAEVNGSPLIKIEELQRLAIAGQFASLSEQVKLSYSYFIKSFIIYLKA